MVGGGGAGWSKAVCLENVATEASESGHGAISTLVDCHEQ